MKSLEIDYAEVVTLPHFVSGLPEDSIFHFSFWVRKKLQEADFDLNKPIIRYDDLVNGKFIFKQDIE